MIKVQLEFHSVPEAIIALNAIMNLPEVKATPVTAAPGAKVAEAKARRERADKGQKRGEYKPRETNAAPHPNDSAKSSEPNRAEVIAAAAPDKVVQAHAEEQGNLRPGHSAVPATIGEKDAEAQKVMELLHGKKGLDACRVLLGQFGVSRIREIPTARRAEFLAQAAEAAA